MITPDNQKAIEDWQTLARGMSFYNAAEGDWHKERDERNECRGRLKTQTKLLLEMGVDVKKLSEEGYLMSESDWR
jgi:hypothetical protein